MLLQGVLEKREYDKANKRRGNLIKIIATLDSAKGKIAEAALKIRYKFVYINRQRKQQKITDKKYAVSAINSAAVIFLRFNPAKYTAPI